MKIDLQSNSLPTPPPPFSGLPIDWSNLSTRPTILYLKGIHRGGEILKGKRGQDKRRPDTKAYSLSQVKDRNSRYCDYCIYLNTVSTPLMLYKSSPALKPEQHFSR